jgi:hypothetical protein
MLADPIDTPDSDECNKFVINAPLGWGYRTFPGTNGLIGALWPYKTTFNDAKTTIFIFLQYKKSKLPSIPDNINLYTEKCQKSNFKFVKYPAKKKTEKDPTLSLYEQYFDGRCGRTMILFEEVIGDYIVVGALVSSDKFISTEILADTKKVMANYKEEIAKYLEIAADVEKKENEKKSSSQMSSGGGLISSESKYSSSR